MSKKEEGNVSKIEKGQLIKESSIIEVVHKKKGRVVLMATQDFYYGEEDFLPVANVSRAYDYGVLIWRRKDRATIRRELCEESFLYEGEIGKS